MLDADRFIRAESVKRAIFIGLTAGVSVLLIADVLRFVPRFDDALSGRPEYLHAVADRMARSLADSTNHQLPALVRQLQEFDCDRTQNVPSRDTDDLYYFYHQPGSQLGIYWNMFRCLKFMGSHTDRTGTMRRLAITNFVAVGCLFLSAAFVSMQRYQIVQPRLVAPPASDTIGASDVLSRASSGEGADVGVALLIFLGPVAGIFRGSILLAIVGALLLAIAVLQYRHLRLGSLVGVAWTLGVVLLLLVAMARISVSYSLAARLLMFGPALALNLALLFGLGYWGSTERKTGLRNNWL